MWEGEGCRWDREGRGRVRLGSRVSTERGMKGFDPLSASPSQVFLNHSERSSCSLQCMDLLPVQPLISIREKDVFGFFDYVAIFLACIATTMITSG